VRGGGVLRVGVGAEEGAAPAHLVDHDGAGGGQAADDLLQGAVKGLLIGRGEGFHRLLQIIQQALEGGHPPPAGDGEAEGHRAAVLGEGLPGHQALALQGVGDLAGGGHGGLQALGQPADGAHPRPGIGQEEEGLDLGRGEAVGLAGPAQHELDGLGDAVEGDGDLPGHPLRSHARVEGRHRRRSIA
jgi:hypothetical protein